MVKKIAVNKNRIHKIVNNGQSMKRVKLFLPLVIFAMAGIFFYVVLTRIDSGQYDPQAMPSALVNKPFPAFSEQRVEAPQQLVTQRDLLGEIAIVNVWATWCPSCHIEHPYLNALARDKGVVIYGVNYNDELQKARNWLAQKGNPYRFNIFDKRGRLGLDMGVTGAPETYLIDHRGFVRLRYQGPLNEKVWQQTFVPLIEQLREEQRGATG